MKHHNLSDTQKFENDQHKNHGFSKIFNIYLFHFYTISIMLDNIPRRDRERLPQLLPSLAT